MKKMGRSSKGIKATLFGFTAALAAFSSCNQSQVREQYKASVYFISWDKSTRYQYGVDEIKVLFDENIFMNDLSEFSEFQSQFLSGEFTHPFPEMGLDMRLYIVCGEQCVYAAGVERLCNLHTHRCKIIDSKFRHDIERVIAIAKAR